MTVAADGTRGLYIARANLRDPHLLGVAKKIESQVAALCALPAEVGLVFPDGATIVHDDAVVRRFGAGTLARRLTYYLHFHRHCADATGLAFVYLRYQGASPVLLWMLGRLRRRNPGLKVLVEIPSYPYEQEARSPVARAKLWLDRCTRGALWRVVDRIVTFSRETRIFGIPTLRTDNGIDPHGLPLQEAPDDGPLRLLGLANLSLWHGYDRVIAGLAAHSRQPHARDVVFDIVGTGAELGRLRQQVADAGLARNVVFHGSRNGPELDALLARAHVGIASLGIHRVQMDSSTLKAREYCARGLPFVLGAEDRDFVPSPYFVFQVPADDSPVDIAAIARFHATLRSRPGFRADMRAYAEQRLTWRTKMAPVLDYLRDTGGVRAA